MLKAASHIEETVMLDVVSPCVTFNDHEGSTKSYKFMQDHDEPLQEISFIPGFEDIEIEYDPGTTLEGWRCMTVHVCVYGNSKRTYDQTDKVRAVTRMNEAKRDGEILTGVLYVNTQAPTFWRC
jgi:2-oxoglutarate ferredoxin oxidoreductase subunit beta